MAANTWFACESTASASSRGATQLHFEVLGLPVLSPDRSAVWVLGGYFYYDWTK